MQRRTRCPPRGQKPRVPLRRVALAQRPPHGSGHGPPGTLPASPAAGEALPGSPPAPPSPPDWAGPGLAAAETTPSGRRPRPHRSGFLESGHTKNSSSAGSKARGGACAPSLPSARSRRPEPCRGLRDTSAPGGRSAEASRPHIRLSIARNQRPLGHLCPRRSRNRNAGPGHAPGAWETRSPGPRAARPWFRSARGPAALPEAAAGRRGGDRSIRYRKRRCLGVSALGGRAPAIVWLSGRCRNARRGVVSITSMVMAPGSARAPRLLGWKRGAEPAARLVHVVPSACPPAQEGLQLAGPCPA